MTQQLRHLAPGLDAEWIPSPNFHTNRADAKITHIVIHAMQGYEDGSIATFQKPHGDSAHYLISRVGRIVQMVEDKDRAFHACNANPFTLGIEHEDMILGQPGKNCKNNPSWFTSVQLDTSARLCAYLMHKFNVPMANIWGHNDPRLRQYKNNHVDPGPYFPWGDYGGRIAHNLMDFNKT